MLRMLVPLFSGVLGGTSFCFASDPVPDGMVPAVIVGGAIFGIVTGLLVCFLMWLWLILPADEHVDVPPANGKD